MANEEKVILHCLGWVSRGGVERRRVTLANFLEIPNISHTLICQVATPPLRTQLENAGWAVHEVGVARGVFDVAWYWRALSIAKELEPTLIHGAVSEGNLMATFLRLALVKPKLIIEETSDFRGRRALGHLLFWLMALRADAVVGVAPEISSMLRQRLVFLSHKVRNITNGVPPHPAVPSSAVDRLRGQYGIAKDDLVAGSMGRLLDSHKRFSDVIRVLARITDSIPNLKLLLIGDGPDRVKLERLAADLDVQDQVIFAGYHEESREFLEVIDVFVLASSGEALPLALIEAMHAGIPAVASRVGGNPFVLDDGRSGLLFDPANLDDLEQHLRMLLESAQRRSKLGREAKKRAQREFSAQRYVREVSELWNDVAGLG